MPGSRRKTAEKERLSFRRLSLLAACVVALVVAFALLAHSCSKEEYRSVYGLPDYVTEDYIRVNEFSRPKIPLNEVNAIVIHYIGNPGTSAEANRNWFDSLAKQSKGDEDLTYASSNFIVGLEGEVIACVPLDEVAYCSNERNMDSISVETCHPDETGKFNDATYKSLVDLTAWLCGHFGLDSSSIIRHYDITGKLCPLYFVEHEDAWEQFKADVQAVLDESGESR